MQIDIIIVNYNATPWLLDCLGSLYEAMEEGLEANIYVVDNASSDGVSRIKHSFPDVRVVYNSGNLGFARAVNRGLELGSAPYALILNPDTRVQSPFFAPMLNFMEATPRAGVLGPRILDAGGNVQGSARRFPSAETALFGRNTLFTRLFPNNRRTARNVLLQSASVAEPTDVDWVSGACMMVRRKAVASVGLLDEDFFMYWEDADWCRRMQEKNWRVVYFPQSVLVHHTGVSSRKNYIRANLEFHRSAYRLFCKSAENSNRWVLKFFVLPVLLFRAYLRIMVTMAAGWKRIW